MHHLSVFVFVLTCAYSCNCLLNSPLVLTVVNETRTYSCPDTCADFVCTPQVEMHSICRNLSGDSSLVYEPCACCKTCARLEGETCGGAFGSNGSCKDRLQCTAPMDEYLMGAEKIGVCLHRVCLKNCSKQRRNPKCGDDGLWYNNHCELRQVNCHLTNNVKKVKEAESTAVCEQACSELTPPEKGQVSYSEGLRHGSVAVFSCNSGYELSHESPVTISCENQQWSNTAIPECSPNPCLNTLCARHTKCVLDADFNAYCQCLEDSDCPGVRYVCGTNGVTYDNLCKLNAYSCRSLREVEVQYPGECSKQSDINSR